MKVARLVVAGIAVVAGLGAAVLIGGGGGTPPPAPEPVAAPEVRGPELTDVLVAVAPIPIGGTLGPQNIGWTRWPQEAVQPYFVVRPAKPDALKELSGAITRAPFQQGEPINQSRLIQGDRGGFLAAMLPVGMRAIAIPISQETGAGGFILPNDRVDVLLTRRDRSGGQDNFLSEIILTNVRVLAIDQTIQERDGEKVVVGKTATLELEPRQTETIALAKQLGELSLALRSLADAPRTLERTGNPELQQRGGTMTIVRFGVPSQVPMFGR